MTSLTATLLCGLGILGLFFLAREGRSQTSLVFWIPIAWLLIKDSRPVSFWLGMTPPAGFSVEMASLEGSPVDRVVFTVLVVAGLAVLIARGSKVVAVLRANWALLIYLSYCGVSILWSDYPDVAFKRWFKAIGDIAMVLIVVTEADPIAALRQLFSRIGFVLIPLSILFIKYYPSLGRGYDPTGVTMYTGVTDQKNILGMVCLLFGLGSLWCVLAAYLDRDDPRRRRRRMIAYGAVFGMAIWLLKISDSVTSTSCLVMGGVLVAAAMLTKVGRRPMVVHILVASFLFLSVFALFFDSGGGLLEKMGRNSTLTGRTEVWHLVLSQRVNPLIGTGFESFWTGPRLETVYRAVKVDEAHNGYLEEYLDLGWIGICLLALVLIAGYRNAIELLRREPRVGAVAVALVTVALIYNCTEAGFRSTDPVWTFFLIGGTIVSMFPKQDVGFQAGFEGRNVATSASSGLLLTNGPLPTKFWRP